MTRSRGARLFRVAALLAVLSMVLGWMEATVPDIHDGHGDAEPEVGAWIQLAHGHPPASSEPPAHAPQAPHSCHCIHVHPTALPPAPAASSLPFRPRTRVSSTEYALASIVPEPDFRPPVV